MVIFLVMKLFRYLFLVYILFLFGECNTTQSKTDTKTSSTKDSKTQECKKPPEGMVCIPGGKAIIGSTKEEIESALKENEAVLKDRENRFSESKSPAEKADFQEEITVIKKTFDFIKGEYPRTEVQVKTFYIDKYEVTNKDYRECIAAKSCKQHPNIKSRLYSRSLDDNQPAVPLTWNMANDFCKWKGKRLPTEAEWEKVARGGAEGGIYPWGNSVPDCNKANYKYCTDDITKPVGSYPAGYYGVHDMAGNGYEWVNDWASDCRDESTCSNSCGKDCSSDNPKGPCNGAFPCDKKKEKVLKGGSWWWSSVHIRGAARRLERMESGGHRLSVRCASDSPILTSAPAWMLKNPMPEPSQELAAPTEDQLKTLHELEAYDTLNKPLCKERFQSPAHCKDPMSYVKTNEPRNWLFAPYIKNLGGGYAGVASDSNYSYIAHAKSEWVWLFDFDINIVNLHRVLKILIMQNANPASFVKSFDEGKEKDTLKLIEDKYKNHPDLEIMKRVFKTYRSTLAEHYTGSMQKDSHPEFGWLKNENAYHYIRKLYTLNRISISPGDMLKEKTMRSIAKSANKLGVPIRIYYPSNAEEFWEYSSIHKENMASLPFDEKSVIISTVEPKLHPSVEWHGRLQGGHAGFWHYIVRGAKNFQSHISNPEITKIDNLTPYRVFPLDTKDFTTILLSSDIESN